MQDDRERDSLLEDSGAINDQSLERSLFDRTFAPIGEGSLRAAILALLASAMGTGMFGFPKLSDTVGVGSAALFIILGALFSAGSMYMIAEIALDHKVQSYGELAERSFGNWFKRLTEFCVVVYPWGITVCFQVVFSKLFMELLQEAFKLSFGTEEREWIRRLVVLAAILLNFAFIFKKDLSSLRYTTLLGTCSVCYCILCVFFTSLVGTNIPLADNKNITVVVPSIFAHDERRWQSVNWFQAKDVWSLFAAVATTVFCYVNHQMLFPLINKLKRPNMRRLSKIFLRVHLGEVLLYELICVFGYLFLVGATPIQALVIQNFTTIPFLLAKAFICVTLFFAVPLGILPAREALAKSLGLEYTNRLHYGLSLALALSGAAIAASYQNVTTYFGLLGGTTGTLMAGTIPAFAYLKITNSWSSGKGIGVAIFYGLMTLVGFTGAIVSVVSPK